MSWLLLTLACSVPAEYAEVEAVDGPEPTDTGATEEDAPTEHMDMDAAWLRRVSIDLRGFPPTEAELDALESEPESWGTLRDDYLEQEHLTERLVHLLAERWHTRVDVFDIEVFDYGLKRQGCSGVQLQLDEPPPSFFFTGCAWGCAWDCGCAWVWNGANAPSPSQTFVSFHVPWDGGASCAALAQNGCAAAAGLPQVVQAPTDRRPGLWTLGLCPEGLYA